MRLKSEDKACLVEEARLKAEQEEQARLKSEEEARFVKYASQCHTLVLNLRSYIDCINLHSEGG